MVWNFMDFLWYWGNRFQIPVYLPAIGTSYTTVGWDSLIGWSILHRCRLWGNVLFQKIHCLTQLEPRVSERKPWDPVPISRNTVPMNGAPFFFCRIFRDGPVEDVALPRKSTLKSTISIQRFYKSKDYTSTVTKLEANNDAVLKQSIPRWIFGDVPMLLKGP